MKPEASAETFRPAPAPDSRPGLRPTLTILFHPNPARIGDLASLSGLDINKPVALSRTEPEFVSPSGEHAALGTRSLSRSPAHLRRAGATDAIVLSPGGTEIRLADGVLDSERNFDASDLDAGVVIELAQRVVILLHRTETPPTDNPDSLGLVGRSASLCTLRRRIGQVADLDVPVLIRGESGTGKELVARALHDASARRAGPFVSVNMAAIPSSVAASELFGHAKGAFTGATAARRGYFRDAVGGTIFLDEIGDTATDVQSMLLRVLESGEIQPVGDEPTGGVDVRIVAATDADLESAIEAGSFRAAVLHRLEGYQLFVSPLRERRDDIGRLFIHFARQELTRTGDEAVLEGGEGEEPPWIATSIVGQIARSRWPGNVRQLRNFVRQLIISNRGSKTMVLDAGLDRLLAAADPTSPADKGIEPAAEVAGALTDSDINEALRAHGFRAGETATALGMSRSSLYARLKRSDLIRQAGDLSAAEIQAASARLSADVVKMADSLQVSELALKRRMRELGLT